MVNPRYIVTYLNTTTGKEHKMDGYYSSSPSAESFAAYFRRKNKEGHEIRVLSIVPHPDQPEGANPPVEVTIP